MVTGAMSSTWKITETRSGDLAVLGPYDEAFVADLKSLPVEHRRWDPVLRAWIVSPRARRSVETIIAKHSPSPLVEILGGRDGVEQVLGLVRRLGDPDEAADESIREGLDLALDGVAGVRSETVRVDGLLVHISVIAAERYGCQRDEGAKVDG